MLNFIIDYSLKNKFLILLFTFGIIGFGLYSITHIAIDALPDITNNQVQVITTSRNLSTADVEKFITYPVELEMANLPGVKQIRSISKFGLSVVTVVFDDKMGDFLPRQLIAEKIKLAEEKIPAEFGKPFMGPITTGLGEIYQYTLEVDPEYKYHYSISDLKTIQDWIIKRQLSGINGVVEVNSWGGKNKQYEVAIDPQRLRALDISITQVFDVLEKNNSIAGGAYIEKENTSYFIRGVGLIENLNDIENIVIIKRENLPIYIKDVAKVHFGFATRFGAITGNGEGEKVLGQVMLLKNANTGRVIEDIKERVAKISHSLPKGIHINPFLERSELIGKTTATIYHNLIFGVLIVIFIVVVLLGNMRSGLVIASVIPLSLMFALSGMYIFDVDANLMSMGAIDFGIIIDGTVIIVEYISFKITKSSNELLNYSGHEKQKLIDKITYESTAKLMTSSIFGQIIIIIVFIPILFLANVEGKMFRPMALVFCFALIGAMILCFTYVPVVSSLILRPMKNIDKNLSFRLFIFLESIYEKILLYCFGIKKIVLTISLSLLLLSGYIYTDMGGEFIPSLDEGDFVIQPVLKTGTNLSSTIDITTNIEKILMRFPEVDQVVSRIGAADVPTDPMSMEQSDVIIKLKPKDEWVSAETKDELANKFKEALTNEIVGLDYEFTQPIEMRFNELITGVRSDLAIFIFGEDLDILYKKALETESLVQNVPGAADITVEKTVGLPQMTVTYDRSKIASYGMNISDLNDIISIGFAGKVAGTVFEGEKQFDLIIRFNDLNRTKIEDLKNATVKTPQGLTVPLKEFANIEYTKGPASISRNDTKRRIVVGINVRDRDLESVVKDVQKILDEKLVLPVGYTVQYGGQFENLRSASDRLKIAVPISLMLIFVLLYFAFNSVKTALMIFVAIPLSSIGGIIALYLRDYPFSISAGVGFIALFGIAVLNGIVLIEHYRHLEEKGHFDNFKNLIVRGSIERLRPVLLTANAAAFGFLPMAISTSSGAEVQKPLATVIIGGLFTSTTLTLFIIPILYIIFNKPQNK